jgi:stage III sporulation protein AA
MITIKKSPFEQAITYLADLKHELISLPRHVTDNVCEIRLRSGHPITLELSGGKRIRLREQVTPAQIAECVREFCGQSVHSCEKQFKEGWLTLAGGHRAGFTGTAVLKNDKIENVRDVSSVNLRIAKEYIGCADKLYKHMECFEGMDGGGLLIIGKPMSAKTTVLRDLCRQVSANHKVALIDERSEIAAVHSGIPALDVGENTDILNGFPKSIGIMNALRNLSPEYVFCDEIAWETDELAALAHCGVKTVMTAHAGGIAQAGQSERLAALLQSGQITHIAELGHGKDIGKINHFCTVSRLEHIKKTETAENLEENENVEQLKHYNHGGDCRYRYGSRGGNVFFVSPEKAGRNALGVRTDFPRNGSFD